MTASIMYNRPLTNGNWASTLLWGRNHSLSTGENANSYLAESTLRFMNHNYVWTRIENVDRTTELLLTFPRPWERRSRFIRNLDFLRRSMAVIRREWLCLFACVPSPKIKNWRFG